MVIFEITLSNLTAQGEIDESDFMDRAKLLGSLGHTVMISDFKEYYRMVDYLSKYTKEQLGLTMGVNNFVEIFDEHYYEDIDGGILEAFGKMFHNNLKVYLYPMKDLETGQIITSNNLKLHPRMKDFYKFFKYNGKIVDIFDYEVNTYPFFLGDLAKIKNGKRRMDGSTSSRSGTKDYEKNNMFGWKSKKMKIDK